MAAESADTNRSRGASTSHGMFSRLNLTVECPTEFGQTVHVSGSSFLAGVSNPALVSVLLRAVRRRRAGAGKIKIETA